MNVEQVLSLARCNTLACLYHNRDRYHSAGNRECAALFDVAINTRLQLLEAGVLEVGQWQVRA